jgi:hypothetical protein
MLGIDARAARYTWTAAFVLLLLCLVYLMRTTLFVFIVALLFGYLLAPLVNVIDRFLPASRTRTPALAIAYLIFIAALFVGVTQIGSRAVGAGQRAGQIHARAAGQVRAAQRVPSRQCERLQSANRAEGRRSTLQEFRRYHLFSAARRRQDTQRGQQPGVCGHRPHSRLLLLKGWTRDAPALPGDDRR